MNDQSLWTAILRTLSSSDSDETEAYLVESAATSITVRKQEVKEVLKRVTEGVGFRTIWNHQPGYASITHPSPEELRKTLHDASQLAREASPDEGNCLPSPEPLPDVTVFDSRQLAVQLSTKIELARSVEKAARSFDKRITNFRDTVYFDSIGTVRVANTLGLDVSYEYSFASLSTTPVAEDGDSTEIAYETEFAHFSGDLNPQDIGKRAAQKAIARLHPTTFSTAQVDIALAPSVTASLLQAIAPIFSAENVLKHKSLFGERLGDQVASPQVTLIDDGTRREGGRTSPLDDEGCPSRRTRLIEAGKLLAFLQDTKSGAKLRQESTGNAFRHSFSSPPSIAPSNLFFEPTGESPETLFQRVAKGLYITDVMGLHTLDTLSGTFSLGARGHILEGGEEKEAVHEIALAGDIAQLFSSIELIANDLRFFAGGGAGSTVLLRDMSVSGK